MTIVLIAAMEQELKAVVNKLNCSEHHEKLDFPIYQGHFGRHEVIVCQSGIGKVHAGIRTALILKEYNPAWVINIGSAGGIHSGIEIGDVIIGNNCCYFDVDVTHFGYKFGQLPAGMPLKYPSDRTYNQKIKQAAHQENIPLKEGLIASGDQFIAELSKTTHIQHQFPNAFVVDMESCAIAQTCYLHNIPFNVLRAVSDHANQQAPSNFYEFLDDIGQEYSQILYRLLSNNEK